MTVAAEEQVTTSRETQIAERQKSIELIEAAKEAQTKAISITVQAEAEKNAAVNRAYAVRITAEGQAQADKTRAEALRIQFEVEAAGKRAVNEAANILSQDQISLETKLALLKILPDLIRESAKPLEAIDSIRIVQVNGLTNNGQSGASGAGATGQTAANSSLANDAVNAALAYRAQAPMIDNLLKEVGLSGGSFEGLVKGVNHTAEETEAEHIG